jgi:dynein light chain Tctex-type 1
MLRPRRALRVVVASRPRAGRPKLFSFPNAKQAIEQTVGTNAFMHTKVNQWTSNVVEGCLKRLAGLQKPFKYVVTCNFVQKAGAGMHTASTALWDGKVDGKHTVQWENQTIQCVATVYWLAI